MHRVFGTKTNWSVSVIGVKKQLTTSSLYCFSNLSSSLLSGFITVVIGIVLVDKREISYWSIAVNAIGIVQSLFNPISNSLYPHIINGRDLCFAYRLGLISVPFLAIGTALFVLLSDFIVVILGGAGYEPASEVLIWLSPVLPISFYGIFIGWPILGALGQVRKLTMSTIIAGLTNVALMGVVVVFDIPSLFLVCCIRCLVEAELLFLRAGALYFYLKRLY